MTVLVQEVANNHTFDFWRNRTNELANAMSTVAVTVNSNTAVGDAAITGTFTANAFTANTITLTDTVSTLTFSTPTTTQISNGQYFLGTNGWGIPVNPIAAVVYSAVGATSQVLDSYLLSQFGGAEYFVTVKDNVANNYQATKIFTTHSFGAAYSTEYARIASNNTIAVFGVSVNATHFILSVTPTTTSATINLAKVTF